MMTYERLRGLSVYPLRNTDPGRKIEFHAWES